MNAPHFFSIDNDREPRIERHFALTHPGIHEGAHQPVGCTGDCEGGRDCTCGGALLWARPAKTPIKSVEQEHRWLWWVYGAAAIAALLISWAVRR